MSQESETLIFYVFEKNQLFDSEDHDVQIKKRENFRLHIQNRLNSTSENTHIYSRLGYYPNRNGDISTFVLVCNTNPLNHIKDLNVQDECYKLLYEKQLTREKYNSLEIRFANDLCLNFDDLGEIYEFGIPSFDNWQTKIIKKIYDMFSKAEFNTEWFIASEHSTWIKILQIVKYISFDDDGGLEWIVIKDPENYERVASIIKKSVATYPNTSNRVNIIFLLTKKFPVIYSFIEEISNGIVFLESEPIFFRNPRILIFSNFKPMGMFGGTIGEIKEDGTYEKYEFDVEDIV